MLLERQSLLPDFSSRPLCSQVIVNMAKAPSDTEIKIGQTMPYSGPLSASSVIGKVQAAHFRMINDRGGVNGRKITLISYDDAALRRPRPSSRSASS